MKKLTVFCLLCLPSVLRATFARDFPFYEPLQPPRSFQVMVHRGMATQAPENTRSAILRTIESGFEWVEIDVRLTRDGHHVLAHDSGIEGKTSGSGNVKDHTLEELLRLDAGSWFAPRYAGERMPTLVQSLELVKGKINLYLDCKDVSPELLVREILNFGMEKQIVVFDRLENLKRIHEISQGRVAIMPKWHPAFGTDSWIDNVRPDAVEIDADELTPEICRAFHRNGIKVQAKTLGKDWDRPEVWDRVIATGVDWIQTDLPEEIISRALWRRLPKRPVRISLHRGAGLYAPENTLPAFERAIRLGADFIEFDVRATKDGQFFLLHDSTLERTTNGTGRISATPASELMGLDAGSWFGKPFARVKIPLLEELLSAVKDRVDLYFDAKEIPAAALAAIIEKHHMTERTVVYQSSDYLKELKGINPGIRRLPPLGNPKMLDSLAADLSPYAVDANWRILSRELIERCHALGILVFADALGSNEAIAEYQKAIRWGIDLIQTDHPMRLLRAIELLSQSP